MADTIKCPNCGSNLKFDPESQKLGCDFCGATFDPSLFEDNVTELTADEAQVKAQQPEAPEMETAAPETVQTQPAEEVSTEVSEAIGAGLSCSCSSDGATTDGAVASAVESVDLPLTAQCSIRG